MGKNEPETLGDLLRIRRVKLDLNQSQVSDNIKKLYKDIKVSQALVAQYERNVIVWPRIDLLKAFSTVLGIPYDVLVRVFVNQKFGITYQQMRPVEMDEGPQLLSLFSTESLINEVKERLDAISVSFDFDKG